MNLQQMIEEMQRETTPAHWALGLGWLLLLALVGMAVPLIVLFSMFAISAGVTAALLHRQFTGKPAPRMQPSEPEPQGEEWRALPAPPRQHQQLTAEQLKAIYEESLRHRSVPQQALPQQARRQLPGGGS